MCGIIAVYDSGSPKSTDSAQLTAKIEKGLEYIPHRGPDATDIWVNDDATCGKSVYITQT
jgi:asparagine synthetase B (glutamine-hydrolysing)